MIIPKEEGNNHSRPAEFLSAKTNGHLSTLKMIELAFAAMLSSMGTEIVHNGLGL